MTTRRRGNSKREEKLYGLLRGVLPHHREREREMGIWEKQMELTIRRDLAFVHLSHLSFKFIQFMLFLISVEKLSYKYAIN